MRLSRMNTAATTELERKFATVYSWIFKGFLKKKKNMQIQQEKKHQENNTVLFAFIYSLKSEYLSAEWLII